MPSAPTATKDCKMAAQAAISACGAGIVAKIIE
jgi:hypothetical protein